VAGYDASKERYTVRLGARAGGQEVAVKPINVRQLIAGARIDASTAARFGFSGSVEGTAVYDTESARYVVTDLRGQSSVSADHLGARVLPENLILPDGTRVNATGLNGRPELNGQPGRVVSTDDENERYVVEMVATGELVKLKYANVVALHGLGAAAASASRTEL
jgi:hypothetical protein